MILPPPRSTLFPYTTLFRSLQIRHNALAEYSRLIGMNPVPCILYCEHARIRKVMFDEITLLITNMIGSPATDGHFRPLYPCILRSRLCQLYVRRVAHRQVHLPRDTLSI